MALDDHNMSNVAVYAAVRVGNECRVARFDVDSDGYEWEQSFCDEANETIVDIAVQPLPPYSHRAAVASVPPPPVQLTFSETDKEGPVEWSPNGQWLLYTATGDDGYDHIWRVSSSGARNSS